MFVCVFVVVVFWHHLGIDMQGYTEFCIDFRFIARSNRCFCNEDMCQCFGLVSQITAVFST